MVRLGHLLGLNLVALATILGRDDNGNQLLVMRESIRITLIRLVAFITTYIGPVVFTDPPLLHNGGGAFLMATNTFA